MSNARELQAQRLGEDHRAAVGRDDRPVGELEVVGRHAHRAVGVDAGQLGAVAARFAQRSLDTVLAHELEEVEAEVADVGPALAVDDHVVDVEGGDLGQVGVLDEGAVGLEPQELAVEHGHDEHPPVGQPAEP